MRREEAGVSGGPGPGQRAHGRVSIAGTETGRLVGRLATEAEKENESHPPPPRKEILMEIESCEGLELSVEVSSVVCVEGKGCWYLCGVMQQAGGSQEESGTERQVPFQSRAV